MQYACAAGGHAAAKILKHALTLAAAATVALAVVLILELAAREKIEFNRRTHESRLLKEALAVVEYDTVLAVNLSAMKNTPPSVLAAWKIANDGDAVAAAVRAVAAGYGGDIVYTAVFDMRGILLQTRIVRHRETPGIADFLSAPDGGNRAVDGVSGATITSNAVAHSAMEIGEWIRYNRERWRS